MTEIKSPVRGASLLDWLEVNCPSIYAQLKASPENKYANQPDVKSGKESARRPPRSGLVPAPAAVRTRTHTDPLDPSGVPRPGQSA